MTQKLQAYLAAVLTTYVSGTIMISQGNIEQIIELGYPVGIAERFDSAWHDFLHMYDLYLPIVAVALLIAFLFTGLLLLRFIKRPQILYPLAGFVALITVHVILYIVFEMNPVAPTREISGMLGQGVAGLLGGLAFLKLSARAS
ncbi:MAG: hypothetical protein HKN50_07525 [Gammaproteobacteria bacterium]|nr:hypothetical protein [Gammaproteobacteria bacterium]